MIPDDFKACPKCGKAEPTSYPNNKIKIKCDCYETPELDNGSNSYGIWNSYCEKMAQHKLYELENVILSS